MPYRRPFLTTFSLILTLVSSVFGVSIGHAENILPTTHVKRDRFEMALPNYLTKSLPVINVSEPSPMQVYRFVDTQTTHGVVFNVMVVPVTQTMGSNLDSATKKFASGIMYGMAKKSGLNIDLWQAINSVQEKHIHNRLFDQAEFTAKSGKTEVYATHTDQHLYAFILSSNDLIKMTEMRAALSSVHLIN